jgi:hypothetical protein
MTPIAAPVAPGGGVPLARPRRHSRVGARSALRESAVARTSGPPLRAHRGEIVLPPLAGAAAAPAVLRFRASTGGHE